MVFDLSEVLRIMSDVQVDVSDVQVDVSDVQVDVSDLLKVLLTRHSSLAIASSNC